MCCVNVVSIHKYVWAPPTLNGSSTLELFECSDAIELCNRIMCDFYPGLPHVHMYIYIVYYNLCMNTFCGPSFPDTKSIKSASLIETMQSPFFPGGGRGRNVGEEKAAQLGEPIASFPGLRPASIACSSPHCKQLGTCLAARKMGH